MDSGADSWTASETSGCSIICLDSIVINVSTTVVIFWVSEDCEGTMLSWPTISANDLSNWVSCWSWESRRWKTLIGSWAGVSSDSVDLDFLFLSRFFFGAFSFFSETSSSTICSSTGLIGCAWTSSWLSASISGSGSFSLARSGSCWACGSSHKISSAMDSGADSWTVSETSGCSINCLDSIVINVSTTVVMFWVSENCEGTMLSWPTISANDLSNLVSCWSWESRRSKTLIGSWVSESSDSVDLDFLFLSRFGVFSFFSETPASSVCVITGSITFIGRSFWVLNAKSGTGIS